MASKSNGVESTTWARGPPPGRTWGETCMRAIYDPDEKTFLGRTSKRWDSQSETSDLDVSDFDSEITDIEDSDEELFDDNSIAITFYLVFYAVLALMFAICMGGLFYIIDYEKPTYVLDSSLIGANPGVSSRPQPLDGVVHYNIANRSAYNTYAQEIQEFINAYANETWVNSRKECTTEDNFGYPDSPCIFIKLNKIYGWKPEIYDSDFPKDMSSDLIEYINSLQDVERQQIWISCWEEHSNATTIEYPWGRGLPGRFYPYLNEMGYISPVLPIRLNPPTNTQSIIRCRAWAKNIVYNKSLKEPSGYVRILLRIDDNTSLNATEVPL